MRSERINLLNWQHWVDRLKKVIEIGKTVYLFFILHNTNCMAEYYTTNVVFVLIIVRKQEHSKVIEFLIKLSAPLNDRIPVFIFFFWTYSVMICYPSLLQRRINTSRSCLMTFILPKKKTCIDLSFQRKHTYQTLVLVS